MSKNPTFSIIVPAYNEEHNVRDVVCEVSKAFTRLDHVFEIIIVNDGSTDITGEILDGLADEMAEVRVVHLGRNHGKGYAIRQGVAHAKGDYVVFTDADLDIHPSQLDRIIAMFNAQTCDIAIGSKRHPESELEYPLSRRVISTVYYWIVKALFGLNVRDTQAGLKIFKRKVLESVLPRLLVKKFAFDLEMLVAAHKLGFRIVEFPIRVRFSRKFGSRITLKDCWRTGIDTLAIFYRHRLLDFYDYAVPVLVQGGPKVSVIIPLATPGANLKRCLEACLGQDYEDYDIFVLPDTDGSVLLDQYGSNDRISIIPTGAVNPAVKRNIGASKAFGEVLAFLDDDAFPSHDWISTAVRHFGDEEGIAAVGGPAVTPADSTMMERISGHILASPIVSGPYRYRYVPHRYREVDDYPSCNFFISADVFKAIGGFSTQHWPGEDTLLCRDIKIKTEKKIVYDPHLLVEHRRRPVFSAHLAQVSRYGLHRGFFLKRWPENSFRLAYLTPSALTLFVLFGFPLLFVPPFQWIYLGTVGVYAGSVLLFSVRLSRIVESVLTFVGIILTHFTYGGFFLMGLIRSKLSEHKTVLTPALTEPARYKGKQV